MLFNKLELYLERGKIVEIKNKKVNNQKIIVSPVGDIDFSNSQLLKADLLKLLEKGYKEVIIDFGQVKSIDSSGLGKLLLFHKRLKEENGLLVVRNVESDYIKNMFNLIHLSKVIKIED